MIHTGADNVAKRRSAFMVFILFVGIFTAQLFQHAFRVYNSLAVHQKQLSLIKDYSLLAGWLILFSGYSIVLYLAQIPKLRFSFYTLIGLLLLKTLLLAAILLPLSPTLLLAAILLPVSPVSLRSITESYYQRNMERQIEKNIVTINLQDDSDFVYDEEDYYGGIYAGPITVNVLPYSSAELNPSATLPECVSIGGSGSRNSIFESPESVATDVGNGFVDVLLKGVAPWILEYEIEPFGQNAAPIRKQLVINGDGKYRSGRHEKLVRINANVIGAYKLVSLRDEKGEGVIVGDNQFSIDPCPAVEFSDDVTKEEIKCMNEFSPSFGIKAFGVAPFVLKYSVTSPSGAVEYHAVQLDQIAEGSLFKLGNSSFYSGSIVSQSLQSPGTYSFELKHVKDSKYTSDVSGSGNHVERELKVIHEPKVRVKNEFVEVVDFTSNFVIPLEVQTGLKDSKFKIKYKYENDVVVYRDVSDVSEIPVEGEGEYTIESIHDSICEKPTTVASNNIVRIVKMKPPSIEISEAISRDGATSESGFEECGFTRSRDVSFKFDVSMSGQPPFKLKYDLLKNNKVINGFEECGFTRSRDVSFKLDVSMSGQPPFKLKYDLLKNNKVIKSSSKLLSSLREVVTINPIDEDSNISANEKENKVEYQVRFTEFADDHYPRVLQYNQAGIFRKIIQRPVTVSVSYVTSALCWGEFADVSLRVSNNFDVYKTLTVEYELQNSLSGLRVRKQLEELIPDNQGILSFRTDVLEEGGTYMFSLTKVYFTENKCDLQIISKKPSLLNIPLRKTEVSFSRKEMYFTADEETIALPVNLEHVYSYPVQIDLLVGDDSKLIMRSIEKPQQKATLAYVSVPNEAGKVEISGVSDALCTGTVIEDHKTVVIHHYPKPSLVLEDGFYSFDDSTRKMTKHDTTGRKDNDLFKSCEVSSPGHENFLKVSFQGEGPFELSWRLNGNIQSTAVNTDHFFIPLALSIPGINKIELVSLNDKRYNNVDVSSTGSRSYFIYQNPTVSFSKVSKPVSICVGSYVEDVNNLPELVYNGNEYPLSVEYSINEIRKTFTINTRDGLSTKSLLHDIQINKTGSLRVKLHSVTDVHGCSSKITTEEQFEVDIAEEPSFIPLTGSEENICINDMVRFSVEGIPDFNVFYDFAGPSGIVSKNLLVHAENEHQSSEPWFTHLISDDEDQDDFRPLAEVKTKASSGITRKSVNLKFKQPGELKVKKLCHHILEGSEESESSSCCRNVERSYFIRPLPKAIKLCHHILEGSEESESSSCCRNVERSYFMRPLPKAIVQSLTNTNIISIREGSEATLTIEFTQGTAPFSFTYARKNEMGIELETHTISDIYESSYQLSLSQAGTYQVVRIFDSFCQFPPPKKRI
ncbi:hypothetical protein MP638_005669 [Amoeboaphelidium occidentale]|nr:hypothetical protein MP638_005669 [Amoeboaphelidium occidentale]